MHSTEKVVKRAFTIMMMMVERKEKKVENRLKEVKHLSFMIDGGWKMEVVGKERRTRRNE